MNALRTIFGPALLAMALVAVVAYLFSRGDEEEFAEPSAAPARPAAPEPEPTAAPPRPSQPETPPAAEPPPALEPPPRPTGAHTTNAPLATKRLPDPLAPDTGPQPPLEPKLRTHAMQMVGPAMKMALERGDLKQLRTVRAFVEQHRTEQLLPQVDVQALDSAIACLENAPEARQEATDFLKFGEKTQFADGVRKLCF